MEPWQVEHINKNRPYLLQNTRCNTMLLATLRSKNIISEEDQEEIESKTTSHQKADAIYKLVERQTGGYNALLAALSVTKQTPAYRVLQQRMGVSMMKTCNLIEYDKNFVLGRGANSVVYKGRMEFRDVAVKRLKKFIGDSILDTNEMKILKELAAHSNIVQFYATYEEPKHLLIAFELCAGSLEDYVKDKSFPLDKREIFRQATTGLGYLHDNNIIHRDLKPENILFAKTSRGLTLVKLADFGLSKIIEEQRQSFTASARHVGGTLSWIAPEILRLCEQSLCFDEEKSKWTLKSDIFPLGCIFWYTLTEGTHPFGSGLLINVNILTNKYSLNGDTGGLMGKFHPLVEQMISADPAGRPACEEILLSECLSSMQPSEDEHRSSTLQAVNAPTKKTTAPSQPATDRATKKVGLGVSAHRNALNSMASSPAPGTSVRLNITNHQREAKSLPGSDAAPSPSIKLEAKGTAEKGNELDIPKTLLTKPGEAGPSSWKSIETWQRYYIYNISGDIQQHVVNKEKFLEQLVQNNVLSKIEAARCKFRWPKFFDTWAFRYSSVRETTLFEEISRRIESYELLMDVLSKTCDSKHFEKLKNEHDLVKELRIDDRFVKASYAIAMRDDADKITALLSDLSNSDLTKLRGQNGESLLHVAVGCGHVQMIHKLHSMGIDTSCKDKDGNHPHHCLGKWSSNVVEVARALLEIGTDISTKSSTGETVAHAVAVHISSPTEFHDWCQFMVEINKEKLLIENNKWQQCSLHYAVTCLEILEKNLVLLKNKGLLLNQRDDDRCGLVNYAARFGRTRTTIEALIKCGVEWNYSEYYGRTVLHSAVRGGNIEAVEYFLNLGANVNAKDRDSRTPLHYLREAYVNHVDITKLLVSKGAKLTELDYHGNTPAHDYSGLWGNRKEEYWEWTKYLLESALVTESYFLKKNNDGELPLPLR